MGIILLWLTADSFAHSLTTLESRKSYPIARWYASNYALTKKTFLKLNLNGILNDILNIRLSLFPVFRPLLYLFLKIRYALLVTENPILLTFFSFQIFIFIFFLLLVSFVCVLWANILELLSKHRGFCFIGFFKLLILFVLLGRWFDIKLVLWEEQLFTRTFHLRRKRK